MIVDGDDFLAVTGTYPKHPMSEVEAKAKTNTELIEQRKVREREDIRQKKTGQDSKMEKLQNVAFKSYY